jgi:exodeoxyribonuclease V gamma subunit
LLLCAGAPPGVELRTTWIARDATLVLRRCDDAHAQLARLLALYARGLAEPLPFFPKSAWAYMRKGESESQARSTWQAAPHHPYGEEADPAYRLALRGRPDPMGEGFADFAACAKAVFEPLLDCAAEAP